ncbi:MAG: hypothetical protein JWQ88_3721 [Rhodoferax sp.]|nr:hypothetical protein [Rhodoferax sp.]
MIRSYPALIVAAQRGWQVAAGLVTSLLILHFLSPVQQGWYYSFVSLAAFFTLFDMGLSLMVIQRSAALFTKLQGTGGGGVTGDNAESFGQLAWFAHSWYRRAAGAYLLLLLPLGLWFFAGVQPVGAPGDAVTGQWPWLWAALLAATAINLWLLPYLSLVEGAGEVGVIYTLRLGQGVLGAASCWLLLAAGAGVWACVSVPAAAAAVGLGWLVLRRPALLALASRPTAKPLPWRTELWPQQWRLAVGWGSGYLLTQIYTPLLLRLEGPNEAGQMGISLTLANALALVSQSWLTHRYPEMAACAARGEWATMMRVFGAAARVYAAVYLAGSALFFTVLLAAADTPYAQRVLPWQVLLTLFAAIFLNQLATGFALALRAARLEPFVWINAAAAVLSLVIGVAMLQHTGMQGLVVTMLGVQALFVLPATLVVWNRRKTAWT